MTDYSGVSGTEHQRWSDAEVLLPCQRDEVCNAVCIEAHEMKCPLCPSDPTVFINAYGVPLCSFISTEDDKRDAGMIADHDEHICVDCAARIGRIEV